MKLPLALYGAGGFFCPGFLKMRGFSSVTVTSDSDKRGKTSTIIDRQHRTISVRIACIDS